MYWYVFIRIMDWGKMKYRCLDIQCEEMFDTSHKHKDKILCCPICQGKVQECDIE